MDLKVEGFLFLKTILMQVSHQEEQTWIVDLKRLMSAKSLPYYSPSCRLGDPHPHPLQLYEEGVKMR